MLKQIEEHILEIENFEADSIESVEHFRIKYLGKKGVLNDLFIAFKDVPNEEKKAFGQALNKLKIKNKDLSKNELARKTIHFEQKIMKELKTK